MCIRDSRPATLSRAKALHLLGAANTTVVATEGNGLLVVDDVVKVSIHLLKRHATDRGSRLARVLVVYAEVVAARASRLLRQLAVVDRVTNLHKLATSSSAKACSDGRNSSKK